MDFNFPFLDVLVIPIGAVSGRRIVIDGVNGTIQVFDSADDLRIQLGGPGAFESSIQFATGDVDEDAPAFIHANVIGAGATRQLMAEFDSPSFDIVGSRERARINLVSEAADASAPEQVALNARLMRLTPDDLLSATAFQMFRGLIQLQDDSDVDWLRLNGDGIGEIELRTNDVNETSGAFIFSEISGAGGTRNLLLTMFSPTLVGEQSLVVQLISESDDGTEPPRLNVTPFSAGHCEISISGITVPRAMVPEFSSVANSAAHADLVVTDMVLNNVRVIAGHTYRFWLHSQYTISAVISTWIVTLNVNGVVTDRFHTDVNATAVAKTGHINAFVDWVAPTTQATDDFAVGVDETTATAATFTLQAAAGNRRTFTVEDMGIRSA